MKSVCDVATKHHHADGTGNAAKMAVAPPPVAAAAFLLTLAAVVPTTKAIPELPFCDLYAVNDNATIAPDYSQHVFLSTNFEDLDSIDDTDKQFKCYTGDTGVNCDESQGLYSNVECITGWCRNKRLSPTFPDVKFTNDIDGHTCSPNATTRYAYNARQSFLDMSPEDVEVSTLLTNPLNVSEYESVLVQFVYAAELPCKSLEFIVHTVPVGNNISSVDDPELHSTPLNCSIGKKIAMEKQLSVSTVDQISLAWATKGVKNDIETLSGGFVEVIDARVSTVYCNLDWAKELNNGRYPEICPDTTSTTSTVTFTTSTTTRTSSTVTVSTVTTTTKTTATDTSSTTSTTSSTSETATVTTVTTEEGGGVGDTGSAGGGGGGGSSGAIAAAVVVVIIVALLILGFIFWRRKQNAEKPLEQRMTAISMTDAKSYADCDVYQDPTTYGDPEELHTLIREWATIVRPEDIHLGQTLGSGEFGEVFLAVMQQGKKGKIDCACKTMKRGGGKGMELEFLKEAAVMGQFRHPNVIRLLGVVLEGEMTMIIIELMANGSLSSYLQKNDGKLSMEMLMRMAKNIADGMAYLASKQFIHRDLAARNILVDRNKTCKVADFGLTKEVDDDSEYFKAEGGKVPIKWTAPEAISHRKYTTSSDVWSYGILLWELMAFGEKPYPKMGNLQVIQQVEKGYRMPAPMDCPRVVHQVMLDCWHIDRRQRKTFPEIVEKLAELQARLKANGTLFDPDEKQGNKGGNVDLDNYADPQDATSLLSDDGANQTPSVGFDYTYNTQRSPSVGGGVTPSTGFDYSQAPTPAKRTNTKRQASQVSPAVSESSINGFGEDPPVSPSPAPRYDNASAKAVGGLIQEDYAEPQDAEFGGQC